MVLCRWFVIYLVEAHTLHVLIMSLQNILFIDIETVPIAETYYGVDEDLRNLFSKKFKTEIEALPNNSIGDVSELMNHFWMSKAGLYAEFAKVVCISIGKLQGDKFYVKAITGIKEKTILETARETLLKAAILCGHNAKEFDVPFLFRRFIINDLPVPSILNTIGKKPWEIQIEDTLEMWGSTQWKYRASLNLLCEVLGIPSPKGDMDGSKVSEVYYGIFRPEKAELPFDKEESALKKIGHYCNGDVVAGARVFCRMKGIEPIRDEQIVFV